jgi:hypothetical protein
MTIYLTLFSFQYFPAPFVLTHHLELVLFPQSKTCKCTNLIRTYEMQIPTLLHEVHAHTHKILLLTFQRPNVICFI